MILPPWQSLVALVGAKFALIAIAEAVGLRAEVPPDTEARMRTSKPLRAAR